MKYQLYTRTDSKTKNYSYCILNTFKSTFSLYQTNIEKAIANANIYPTRTYNAAAFGKLLIEFDDLTTFPEKYPEFFI